MNFFRRNAPIASALTAATLSCSAVITGWYFIVTDNESQQSNFLTNNLYLFASATWVMTAFCLYNQIRREDPQQDELGNIELQTHDHEYASFN